MLNTDELLYINTLKCRIKALRDRVKALEDGSVYQKITSDCIALEHEKDREIRELKKELARERARLVTSRNGWIETLDDTEAEYERKLTGKDRSIERLREKLHEAQGQRDRAKRRITELEREKAELAAQLEDEKAKNQKLLAQLHRDYENSSKPSSMTPNHKKISNSREKTGRKPGGQPGHPGHCRKKQEPTKAPVHLEPSDEILNDPDFKKTGKIITKQWVDIRVTLEVTVFTADEYYNSKTGEHYHAPFPPGVNDDVNYGGSIKAFAYLQNNECDVSIDKTRDFMRCVTGGKLDLSKGMVSGLLKEFSEKTAEEKEADMKALLACPVMNTDMTNARMNGENRYVSICASADGKHARYFALHKKGHEGVRGTPVENYQGTMVHDHDRTYYKYGGKHQECLAHVLRYLKDSIENEKDLEWNKEMHSLIQKMIHARNSLPPGTDFAPETVADFERRYHEVLRKGASEYEEKPPGKYYPDGFNLCKRMTEYAASHLLFLHDLQVPTNNNLSERKLRNFKRKQKQMISFRSDASLAFTCDGMSTIDRIRSDPEKNLFQEVTRIFER